MSRVIRIHYRSLRRLSSLALSSVSEGYNALQQAPQFGRTVGDTCLRDSTAAVARRLTQQTQFPLLPGTPFTVEGALATNPFHRPRLILTPGPSPSVVHANPEWQAFSGFTEDEGPGMEASTKMKIRAALESNSRLRVPVVQFCKDGMPNMMILQLSPLLNQNGTVSHILACLKDSA